MRYIMTKMKPFGIQLSPNKKNSSIKSIEIDALKPLFSEAQIIVLRGFESFKNADDFAQYCALWGEVSIWPFGKVLELIEHANPKDHIFDHSYVPLHWDGMYRSHIPKYQIFHCVNAPLAKQGGRTTFSNTMLALQNSAPELIALLHKVTGIYERKMAFYHSKTRSPIITQHPEKNYPVIRYNEPHIEADDHFINPPHMQFVGATAEELTIVHRSLKEILYHRNHFYAHEWQTGDVVIADNFSLLHGREAFTPKSPRHIQRVHVLSDPPFRNPSLESYDDDQH